MRMAFLLFVFTTWGCHAVTDHKPRESELPVGPVHNMYPSLTWNDSHYRDSGISYNRENGPSLSLRKSDNSNGGYSYLCCLVFLRRAENLAKPRNTSQTYEIVNCPKRNRTLRSKLADATADTMPNRRLISSSKSRKS